MVSRRFQRAEQPFKYDFCLKSIICSKKPFWHFEGLSLLYTALIKLQNGLWFIHFIWQIVLQLCLIIQLKPYQTSSTQG